MKSESSTLPMPAASRKRILRVLLFSLLLDLISFTFILPLFPRLLEFYRGPEGDRDSHDGRTTLLNNVLRGLNAYKHAFARPINDRYDVVLLGGALGSLFSFLQAIAAPVIGRLSDRYGRRKALLWCMTGNLLSVALWVAATDFRTFLASRVVGGLSEGNVQIATEIAADVSDERSRGSTMALIGACFSIAFTVGPALGAALSTATIVAANPFATTAAVSFGLIAIETAYLYLYLPETRVFSSSTPANRGANDSVQAPKSSSDRSGRRRGSRSNGHFLLNLTHFTFLLFFSGLEFSLPFLTYDLFSYGSKQSGRLLGVVGLIASILQGSVVRRLDPLRAVQAGVVSCALSFFVLVRLETEATLYFAATLLAVTSATVVTGLKSLASFEATQDERGGKLGNHRSWGQLGRSLGPVIFCSLYWWAGRQFAYRVGGTGMLAVSALVLFALVSPAPAPGRAGSSSSSSSSSSS